LIQPCDVGSLPYTDKLDKLMEGANHYATGLSDDSERFFEHTIVEAFLDKLEAGISVAAFPQFRDMNEMFLSTFEGIERIKSGYVETGRLTLRPKKGKIPEVAVIKKNAAKVHEQKDIPFQLRICVTGPYTLASFFPYKTSQTYTQLGQVLSEVVDKNIFAVKHGKVALVSIDEPLFGLVDDPLIDRGTEGRENLLSAWELLANEAKRKSVATCIHLHCTSDDLFWSVRSLGIVESHVGDPLYEMQITKRRLEEEDKLLKASIAITDFDHLMKEKLNLNASDDAIADAWRNILNGNLDPKMFLENVEVMKKRLAIVIGRFGVERVALAGPECGLRGFPTYTSAISCLSLVSKAAKSIAR